MSSKVRHISAELVPQSVQATATRFIRTSPNVGEFIRGCSHSTACGRVCKVGAHVSGDGMDHWIVTEDWNERAVRVRREPDGNLYDVDLRIGCE